MVLFCRPTFALKVDESQVSQDDDAHRTFQVQKVVLAAVGAARLPRHPGRHRAGPKFSGSRRKSPDLRGRKRDRVQDQE